MTYDDAAPNVSKLRTEAQFKADFPPSPSPPAPLPEPDASQKAQLYAAFRDEYNSNGGAVDVRRLAQAEGVPLRWCLILAKEIVAGKAAVYAEPE